MYLRRLSIARKYYRALNQIVSFLFQFSYILDLVLLYLVEYARNNGVLCSVSVQDNYTQSNFVCLFLL